MSQSSTAFAAPTTNRRRPERRPSSTSRSRPCSTIGISPGRQAGDLVGVDVGADDLVAEVGEARAGGQSDVSRSDDGDPRHAWKLPDGVAHRPLAGGSPLGVAVHHYGGAAMLPRAAAGRSPVSSTPAVSIPATICEAVWDGTPQRAAGQARRLVDRPAADASSSSSSSPGSSPAIARRIVRRAVYRLVVADRDAARALQTVGVARRAATVDDPRRDGPGVVDHDGRRLDGDRDRSG